MKKALIIFGLIILQFGCSSNNDSNEDQVVPNDPSSAILIFPHENSLCNEGTNITETHSTVLFEWWASNDTDTYVLTLKNLSTENITTHETTLTEISVELNRATQYQWFVTSKSNAVSATAQSSTWVFYNSGGGNQNYAPFPAQIVFPEMAKSYPSANEITLMWTGDDVDDDIEGYDVYFGTENPPSIYANDLVEESLEVPITNTIYYWKIITKDSQGNNSDSGVYQFRIQ